MPTDAELIALQGLKKILFLNEKNRTSRHENFIPLSHGIAE
jgi:hypothetical protein